MRGAVRGARDRGGVVRRARRRSHRGAPALQERHGAGGQGPVRRGRAGAREGERDSSLTRTSPSTSRRPTRRPARSTRRSPPTRPTSRAIRRIAPTSSSSWESSSRSSSRTPRPRSGASTSRRAWSSSRRASTTRGSRSSSGRRKSPRTRTCSSTSPAPTPRPATWRKRSAPTRATSRARRRIKKQVEKVVADSEARYDIQKAAQKPGEATKPAEGEPGRGRARSRARREDRALRRHQGRCAHRRGPGARRGHLPGDRRHRVARRAEPARLAELDDHHHPPGHPPLGPHAHPGAPAPRRRHGRHADDGRRRERLDARLQQPPRQQAPRPRQRPLGLQRHPRLDVLGVALHRRRSDRAHRGGARPRVGPLRRRRLRRRRQHHHHRPRRGEDGLARSASATAARRTAPAGRPAARATSPTAPRSATRATRAGRARSRPAASTSASPTSIRTWAPRTSAPTSAARVARRQGQRAQLRRRLRPDRARRLRHRPVQRLPAAGGQRPTSAGDYKGKYVNAARLLDAARRLTGRTTSLPRPHHLRAHAAAERASTSRPSTSTTSASPGRCTTTSTSALGYRLKDIRWEYLVRQHPGRAPRLGVRAGHRSRSPTRSTSSSPAGPTTCRTSSASSARRAPRCRQADRPAGDPLLRLDGVPLAELPRVVPQSAHPAQPPGRASSSRPPSARTSPTSRSSPSRSPPPRWGTSTSRATLRVRAQRLLQPRHQPHRARPACATSRSPTKAAGLGGLDPATGQYTAAFGGWDNSGDVYNVFGGELGAPGVPGRGPRHLRQLRAQPRTASSTPSPGCNGPTTSAPASTRSTLGVQLRTKIGFNGEITFYYQSAQVWNEQVATLSGIVYQQFPLPAYTLLNGRLGWRFFKDRIEVSGDGLQRAGGRLRARRRRCTPSATASAAASWASSPTRCEGQDAGSTTLSAASRRRSLLRPRARRSPACAGHRAPSSSRRTSPAARRAC